MEDRKTRIFMTGATGVMGSAGLKEIMARDKRYAVTVLARDSKANRKKLEDFIKRGLNVIWGDLLDKDKIKEGLEDADIVLHVGGMVSPVADRYPEKTMKVNVGSMRLIADGVKEIEEKDKDRTIRVVYIGSVSQYGSKLPPDHWGSAEDKQEAARLDAYAESKIESERVLREAGLKRWVSLRQTAILHDGLMKKAFDPITFHVPLMGVLEWVSVEDSGRILERVCREDVPDSFWGKAYNIGGGKDFRLTNLEFERRILSVLGCPPPEKIFETNWFATRNFHGMWFKDSDALDEILHYREPDTFEAALERLKRNLPFYYKLTPLVPAGIIKFLMKKVAEKKELGPLWWIKNRIEERIEAAWGSEEEYRQIPVWEHLKEADNLS